MVTAPEYGGTFTYAYALFGKNTDPSIEGGWAGFQLSGVNENLVQGDWGLPRDEFGFTGNYVPTSVFRGNLADELGAAGQPDVHRQDQTGHSLARQGADERARAHRRRRRVGIPPP